MSENKAPNNTPSPLKIIQKLSQALINEQTKNAALTEEIELLMADALRWRWIADNATSKGGGDGFTLSVFVPHDIEDWGCAVDYAIAAGSE